MNENLCLIHYKPRNLTNNFKIHSGSVRQYFVDTYQHPLFHNHYPNGKSIYRSKGAAFQFKVINNEVFILALDEGADFAQSFQWPQIINMPLGKNQLVVELELFSKTKKQSSFQKSESKYYRNVSPYIALNQKNQKEYLSFSEIEKRAAIEKGLINHILTAAKWCGVTVSHKLEINLILMREGIPIKIKDDLSFVPFDVMFECNTEIPDYIGIGKFVSRGYGTVIQYG
ncbi:CRISPR-associated endonuclease Cas6 [Methanosarcina hadiensis]|uniref:CRISPR-associated endonuclease Cas6 n=1 Tax=Methanosarcina hadiensis TaxID=3078083 RepID=UPI0039776FBE